MADHPEMIHAAAAPAALYRGATRSSTTQASHGGDWWSTVVAPPVSSCSPEMPGFVAWSAAAAAGGHVDGADGNTSRSSNTASSESPGSNSLATGSSITFQEPTGVADPATIAVPQTAATGFATGWSQSFLSSLLRSLTEPAVSAAAAKPNSPGFQQYQQTMNEAPAASIRQPLQFTNNTPFWNPSTGFATVVDGAALGVARPPLAQTRPASLAAKCALGVGDSCSVITKKENADPTPLRKTRTGTPSPLPTFKVRKEKLGDRITALQQLISPFGMTDTASVLHETIEYIKFLHEQVGALSAPYLKNRPQQVPHLKSSTDKSKDGGEAAVKRDLTGRGLCLVPISSTYAVPSETPVDNADEGVFIVGKM